MTTPHTRDFRLAKNEYVIQVPKIRDTGNPGQGQKCVVPFRSRCRGVMLNIKDEVTAAQTLNIFKNASPQTGGIKAYTIPANTGPDDDGDEFEFLDFSLDTRYAEAADSLYLPGYSISVQSNGAGDANDTHSALIMKLEGASSTGLIAHQVGQRTNQSAAGDFPIPVLMNRDVVVRGVCCNNFTSPDDNDIYGVRINGAATVPVSEGVGSKGAAAPPDFFGEFVGIRNVTLPKFDLLEIHHSGTSTGVNAVLASVILASNGPLNEHCLQLGEIANITTPNVDFSIPVTMTEPSIIKGIVIHTEVLTDAIDIWKLRVNGADVSPSVTFSGTDGLAANSGEFIAASSRLELLPGDRVELRSGGQSTSGKVYAALVIQV